MDTDAQPSDKLDRSTSERLSNRLRIARRTRGMTLKALAEVAGCSESLLSKIENGKGVPSLATMDRIVCALNVSMGWVFDNELGNGVTVRRIEQIDVLGRRFSKSSTLVEKIIAAENERVMQCAVYHIKPGACSAGQHRHPGHEAGYVIAGRLDLEVDKIVYHLEEGDCFSFFSDQSHNFVNSSDVETIVFWVTAAPEH